MVPRLEDGEFVMAMRTEGQVYRQAGARLWGRHPIGGRLHSSYIRWVANPISLCHSSSFSSFYVSYSAVAVTPIEALREEEEVWVSCSSFYSCFTYWVILAIRRSSNA
jgi:hypothetical protein